MAAVFLLVEFVLCRGRLPLVLTALKWENGDHLRASKLLNAVRKAFAINVDTALQTMVDKVVLVRYRCDGVIM